MDSSGNIREVTKKQPIEKHEIPLTAEQAETISKLPRSERRRIYREEAKKHRKMLGEQRKNGS